MDRISLGRLGENEAVRSLQGKGLSIVQRNFRCKLGELDIVARDGPFLVFVEVRTVTGYSRGTPQESITPKKKRRLRKLAMFFMQYSGLNNTPARFDVIAVTISRETGVIKLEHIINAF